MSPDLHKFKRTCTGVAEQIYIASMLLWFSSPAKAICLFPNHLYSNRQRQGHMPATVTHIEIASKRIRTSVDQSLIASHSEIVIRTFSI